jgi:hypothetical protein
MRCTELTGSPQQPDLLLWTHWLLFSCYKDFARDTVS